eukprot:gene30891-38178_t
MKFKRAPTWPQHLGNFLQFTLFKENIDTMSAITVINKSLRLSPGAIAYNGTKDKRGVTAQKCTVYRRKPSDFARINSYAHPPTIRVGDFEYVKEQAGLGALTGNRFEIVLRSLNKTKSDIALACKALEQSGFINYYGLQRFGKGGSKSHDVGRAIFKSDFKACVDMLFTLNAFDRDSFRKAKNAYNEGHLQKAVDLMPENMYGEKQVLIRLLKNPSDHAAAYHGIQKNTRLICAHAYQSFIWNQVASRRVQKYGLVCIEGDLVPLDPSIVATGGEDAVIAEDNSITTAASASSGNSFQSSNKDKQGDIHVVTAEDVAAGRFSMKDVILPLPGLNIVLPKNDIGDFYVELLAKDGLTLDDYSRCHKEYRMSGAYRRVIQQPQDLEWSILQYEDSNAELAVTELTAMRQAQNIASEEEVTAKDAKVVVLTSDLSGGAVESEKTESRFTALQLKFTLPPGTYATMLLRELTKESTETQFQAQLSSTADSKPYVSNNLTNTKTTS